MKESAFKPTKDKNLDGFFACTSFYQFYAQNPNSSIPEDQVWGFFYFYFNPEGLCQLERSNHV